MPIPERIKKIIDANVPPSMRDYYYRMVQKESGGVPTTSKTGAAGLLQFTRGTGKLYGLVSDKHDSRNDPEANIRAGVRLTEDNKRLLTRMLGREPSYSELALAHQQGAQTAGQMLLGKGNAPAHHLAVNNVPANLPPQEAARHIMNYYGFGGPPRRQGVPGMTLNSTFPAMLGNEFGPQAPPQFPSAPLPGAAPLPLPGPVVDPRMATGQLGVAPTAAAAPAELGIGDRIKAALMGPDGKGGKGSAFEGADQIAAGISPKVNPAVAAEAARADSILGRTGGADTLGGSGGGPAAMNLLQQMLQNKRQKYGLSLTGR
jgi:hypothetical protein